MMQESKFARTAHRVTCLLWDSFLHSRTKRYLYEAVGVLSGAFFLSMSFRALRATKALYPRRVWGIFEYVNPRLKSTFDIFHPLFIFPLVFAGFIAISSYRVSNLALASILIGIGFFSLGVLASRRFKFRELAIEANLERFTAFLLLVGITSLIYDVMQTGSIPLLDPAARRQLSVPYTMLASLTVPGGILLISLLGKRHQRDELSIAEARVYALITMLIITALMSLLGYRTQIIVSLLGSAIAMYYSRLIGKSEILLSFILAFIAISAFGYYRALAQGSSVEFLDIIGKRVGLTLSIYDALVERFWAFGANKGTVFLATISSFLSFVPGPRLGPRTIVAQIYGVKDVSITSTLYGTVVLDFGIPGIALFSLLLGFVLGTAYMAVKQTRGALSVGIFSLLLAYALVGIETGLVDFNVAVFFFAGFLLIFHSRRR